jgi:cytochrome b pre-mRNA-processing protein 3
MLAFINFSSASAGADGTARHCIGGPLAQYAVDRRRTRAGVRTGINGLVSFLKRLFPGRAAAEAHLPLYTAIVAEGRRPHWYAAGGVPDTFDGRFDMVSSVLALVLLRLEADDAAGREAAARVTELFITDMDGTLRERGIGDLVVGKHMGKIMGALGGRTGAYKAGLAPGGDLAGAIDRNLYRGEERTAAQRDHVETELRALAAELAATDLAGLLAGRLGAMPA